jgi:polar amino acid transport system substrate-binding protein
MEIFMTKGWHFVLTCIAAAVIAFGVSSVHGGGAVPANATQNVYDRIMQSHEIRCGYVNYPPLLSKDPNTGKFSGIGVEIMERIAEMLNVKLQWVEETSWAHYIEGLNTNRFDMLCGLDFFPPSVAGKVEGTAPLFYAGIGIYKRADDTRFPEGFRNFNDPNITISAIDGSISMQIKNADYPDAQLLSMPAMTDYSTILLNVVDKKADVTFVERAVAHAYLKANPGKLVNIASDKPLRVFSYFIPFRIGETKLKATMDGLINLMRENGEIDKILDKYEEGTPSFYRAAKGYR